MFGTRVKSRPVKLDIPNIFDVKTNTDAKNLPDVNLDHWSKMVGAYNSITFDEHTLFHPFFCIVLFESSAKL